MVVGDPAGMHALADHLSRNASTLRDTRHSLTRAWGDKGIEGPWGDELGFLVAARAQQLGTAADHLDSAVKLLRSTATTVEEEQAAEERRFEEAERQRHLAALRAAQQQGRN